MTITKIVSKWRMLFLAGALMLLGVPLAQFGGIHRLPESWCLVRIRWATTLGDSHCLVEVEQAIRAGEAAARDKHAFADELLSNDEPSVVAEGLILAVRYGHPRTPEILSNHLRDDRWNYLLTTNSDLARSLLLQVAPPAPAAYAGGGDLPR